MEKVMDMMNELCKKSMDCMTEILKRVVGAGKDVLAQVKSKTDCCVCSKAKAQVETHRKELLLGAAIVSGVAAVASCVGYLLNRKK